MSHTDGERASIFLAPPSKDVEDQHEGTVDGSDEAMRRLRHPFQVQPSTAPARRGSGVADHESEPVADAGDR